MKLRWRLWGLLCRSRRVCPSNAHSALIWRTKPLREVGIDWMCRSDCAANGACWCGKLRAGRASTSEGVSA